MYITPITTNKKEKQMSHMDYFYGQDPADATVDAKEIGYVIVGEEFAHEINGELDEATLDNELVHTTCVTDAIEIARSLTAFLSGECEMDAEMSIYVKEHLGGDAYISETLVKTVKYNYNSKKWGK